MTAILFLLIQASAPMPLKFIFLIGGVVVLIIGILIFAYRSYISSPEPTEDEMSSLHIGSNPTVPKLPKTPSPATRKTPVMQQTAKLSTPMPVENKIVPPPIILTEPAAPAPLPEPTRPLPPEPPRPLAEPTRPLPEPTRALPQRDMTSPFNEELPSSAPRTLASPRVFSPATPRQESAPLPAPVDEPPAYVRQSRRQSEPAPVREREVFGSLTEGQKNQSRSNRFTLMILLVAVIVVFVVAFKQVPLFHDTIMEGYDKVTGHNPPPPPPPQTPKIEIEPKVTLAGPILYVDGKVRNISDGPLDNLYVEVAVLYANGKLSETRLIPIVAGTGQPTTAAQNPKETAQQQPKDAKEDRSLPTSKSGSYSLQVPGSIFRDAVLKRVLKEDGTEVMFQKR